MLNQQQQHTKKKNELKTVKNKTVEVLIYFVGYQLFFLSKNWTILTWKPKILTL